MSFGPVSFGPVSPEVAEVGLTFYMLLVGWAIGYARHAWRPVRPVEVIRDRE